MEKISITRPQQNELENQGVFSWPVWTCEISEFPWTYNEQESCYILEGNIEVIIDEETIRIGAEDFVVFPKGLNCTWKVKSPVRKHYSFGE